MKLPVAGCISAQFGALSERLPFVVSMVAALIHKYFSVVSTPYLSFQNERTFTGLEKSVPVGNVFIAK